MKNKERLHLAMPPGTRLLLDKLQERIGAGSMTEVIRRSLSLLDFITTQGNKVYYHTRKTKSEVIFK